MQGVPFMISYGFHTCGNGHHWGFHRISIVLQGYSLWFHMVSIHFAMDTHSDLIGFSKDVLQGNPLGFHRTPIRISRCPMGGAHSSYAWCWPSRKSVSSQLICALTCGWLTSKSAMSQPTWAKTCGWLMHTPPQVIAHVDGLPLGLYYYSNLLLYCIKRAAHQRAALTQHYSRVLSSFGLAITFCK